MLTKHIQLPVVLLVFLSGCAPTGHITIQGQDFRTGAAQQALLGSVGHFAYNGSFLFGTYLFERGITPPYKDIKLRTHTIINDNERQKVVATAKASAVGLPITGGAGIDEDWLRTATYHSIAFESKPDLVDFFNDPSNNDVLQYLLRWNTEARVVTGTLVGYQFRESDTLKAGANVTLNKIGDVVNVTVAGKGDRKRELGFSDGTIVGYLYDRPCWMVDASGNPKIADLRTDNPTTVPGATCPKGTYRNAKKAIGNP